MGRRAVVPLIPEGFQTVLLLFLLVGGAPSLTEATRFSRMVAAHVDQSHWARPFFGIAGVVSVLAFALSLLTRSRTRPSRPSPLPLVVSVRCILQGGVAVARKCLSLTRRVLQYRKSCCVFVLFLLCARVSWLLRFSEVASASTFFRYYLSHLRPWPDNPEEILESQRKSLAEEMESYDYPGGRYNITATSLADLVPELGGQPIRSIVVTSWRSGSTFLGAILNSHPATFYHFEPLIYFAGLQIRSKIVGDVAVKDLRALLTCDYSQLTTYLAHVNNMQGLMFYSINTRLWEQCYRHPRLCWRPDFLTPFCRLFPFHSMKIVRLRLQHVETLLSDPSLNVRVIYLVRDPRGTLRSRNNLLSWCSHNPDCIRADRLCQDLESDYAAAGLFAARYPNTFRAVRYEDLAVDTYTRVRELFAFLGLSFHAKVLEYLDTHTQADQPGDDLNTHHASKSTPFSWQRDLTHEKVAAIQAECDRAMELWGYLLAHNQTHQQTFTPVGGFKLD